MKISIGCRNFKQGCDWSLCLLSALNAAPHVFTTKLFNLLAIKQSWVSLLGSPFHSQTLVTLDKSLFSFGLSNRLVSAVFSCFDQSLILPCIHTKKPDSTTSIYQPSWKRWLQCRTFEQNPSAKFCTSVTLTFSQKVQKVLRRWFLCKT